LSADRVWLFSTKDVTEVNSEGNTPLNFKDKSSVLSTNVNGFAGYESAKNWIEILQKKSIPFEVRSAFFAIV
jgi:hypothetical protein